jgi:hypothetical protein
MSTRKDADSGWAIGIHGHARFLVNYPSGRLLEQIVLADIASPDNRGQGGIVSRRLAGHPAHHLVRYPTRPGFLGTPTSANRRYNVPALTHPATVATATAVQESNAKNIRGADACARPPDWAPTRSFQEQTVAFPNTKTLMSELPASRPISTGC